MLMTMLAMYTDLLTLKQKDNLKQRYTMVELILEGI